MYSSADGVPFDSKTADLLWAQVRSSIAVIIVLCFARFMPFSVPLRYSAVVSMAEYVWKRLRAVPSWQCC
jgi:hypothetical protein